MKYGCDVSGSGQAPLFDYASYDYLCESGRYDEALIGITKFLTGNPTHIAALDLAAICLYGMQGKRDIRTVSRNGDRPIDRAAAMNELGCWFYARGRLDLAEQAYRRALSLRPDWPFVMTNLGIVVRDQRREREAEAIFQRALAIAPDDARAHNSYGVVLWRLKQVARAEREYREAIRLQAGFRDAYNNLGLLLTECNRLSEAEEMIRQSLAVGGATPEACNNLGSVLMQQGRVREAVDAYRKALALRPGYVAAKANLALPLLATGEYREGWALYEARHDPSLATHFTQAPRVAWPRWNGEPLAGKSLLVWPELGYGDVLQFCRYLMLLKARGVGRLSTACQPALQRLLRSLEGIDAVYPLDGQAQIPQHDFWCFVMSLPHLCGTTVETIPAPMPYLRAPADLVTMWRRRLPAGDFRVGIVWAGNPRLHALASNAFDQRRSMSPQMLLPILRTPGVTFVSLQKGETTQPQISSLRPELQPFDPMDDVQDFADTAAIIECLDLVIAVDTSVVHVAGALNKPVWILSRYDACWRWLRDRDDSPWYPRARLFRQTEPGNWSDVAGRVADELAKLVRPAAPA